MRYAGIPLGYLKENNGSYCPMYELNASLPAKGQRQDLYLHGGPPGQLLSAMPSASLVSKLAFYGGGIDWMSIVRPNPLGQSVQLRRGMNNQC
jgi:hypothetical protein